MFCNKCGAPNDDGNKFCKACGNPIQAAAPQAPQQPVYQQPVAPQKPPKAPFVAPTYKPLSLDAAGWLKKYSHIVACAVAVIALIAFILTAFCITEVNYTVDYGRGMTGTGSAGISKINSNAMLYVGNILYGLVHLAIAGVATLVVLKKFCQLPLYDQLIGRLIKLENPTFLICGVGIVFGFIQMLLYLPAGGKYVSCGVSWCTWTAMALYAIIGVADLVAQGKKD